MFLDTLIFFKCTLNIASRSLRSGRSIPICLSKRPGRINAESRMSGLFVAAIMITPLSVLNPSISTNSWLSVFSRSSLPPCTAPRPLALPMASISSMNTIHGAFSRACLNRSRTLDAPTPTNISTKSDPDIEKNGTLASPATALANSVLPVPGGPTKSTPLGILPPRLVYFFGFLRKSTTSITSSLASSSPATSWKVIFTLEELSNNVALDLPILNICAPGPPAPPPTRRMIKSQMATKNNNGNTQLKIVDTQFSRVSYLGSRSNPSARSSLTLSSNCSTLPISTT